MTWRAARAGSNAPKRPRLKGITATTAFLLYLFWTGAGNRRAGELSLGRSTGTVPLFSVRGSLVDGLWSAIVFTAGVYHAGRVLRKGFCVKRL